MIHTIKSLFLLNFLFVFLLGCATTAPHSYHFYNEQTGLKTLDTSYELWNREWQREGVLRLHRRQENNGGEAWFFLSYLNTEWVGHFDTLVVVLDGVEHALVDLAPIHLVQSQEITVPTGRSGRSMSVGVSSGGNVRVGASTTIHRSDIRTTTTTVTTHREEIRVLILPELLQAIASTKSPVWLLRNSTQDSQMAITRLSKHEEKVLSKNILTLLETS
jgi:hypothetical protein